LDRSDCFFEAGQSAPWGRKGQGRTYTRLFEARGFFLFPADGVSRLPARNFEIGTASIKERPIETDMTERAIFSYVKSSLRVNALGELF
jgi:hypothetical protein